MALVLKDRIKQQSTTTGTGTVTLGAAYDGFSIFSAFYSNGDEVYYTISNTETGITEWEVGRGTFNSAGPTLVRDTVLSSTNSGSLVSFSAGVKEVFVTYPAERAVTTDDIGTIASQDANNVSITAGSIAVTADPTTPLQVATKDYVDNLVSSSIHFHESVRLESPDSAGNLSSVYNNGTAGVGATLTNNSTQVALVVDGVTTNTSDRILIYNQTDATENGVYVVTDVGSGATNWVLTRSADTNTSGGGDPNSLDEGSYFLVTDGDTGAGESYVCSTVGTITFGTTDITFAQFSSSLNYIGGTNIDITGRTISVEGDIAVADGGTGASTESGARTNLGVAIGSNVQAWDAQLDDIAGLATTDSNIIVGNGTNWVAESGATARTSLGVPANDGTGATGTWSISISGNAATATDGVVTTGSYADPSWITSLDDGKVLPTMTGNSGNYLTTDGTNSSWAAVPSPNNGTLSLSTSGNGLSGSATFTADQAGGSTFTVTSNATNANTANAIVSRDASGNFNAGTITAALSGNASGLSSTLAVTSGGTGQTTYTNGQLLIGNTTGSTLTKAALTAGTGITVTNGSGAITIAATNNGTVTSVTGTAPVVSSGGATPAISMAAATTSVNGYLTSTDWNTFNNKTTNTGTVTSIIAGTYLTGGTITTTGTLAVDATNLNTASKVVARDASGNFSAGTITAALSGNATTSSSTSGNAASATVLQTARTINGTSFNGSADITITAAATNVNTQLASLGVGTAASGTAGEIRATDNITAYYSDDRLKTRGINIQNALDKVASLNGFYYQANEVANALGYVSKPEVGVSAQEVQAVLPEVVVPAPIDDKYLTVHYDKLVPLLIEAIKELKAEVDELKSRCK